MQWVSVNERLPEPGRNVLIFTKSGNVGEGNYIENDEWVQYRWSVPSVKVTHWMPLPEPPTASNNGFNLTPPVDGAS